MGELAVALEAMTRGAEVLRNLSPNAENDLCIVINEAVIQIDVKVAQWSKSTQGWHSGNIYKVMYPVYPVKVNPVGCSYREWQFCWHKDKSGRYKCPPGLENFWD